MNIRKSNHFRRAMLSLAVIFQMGSLSVLADESFVFTPNLSGVVGIAGAALSSQTKGFENPEQNSLEMLPSGYQEGLTDDVWIPELYQDDILTELPEVDFSHINGNGHESKGEILENIIDNWGDETRDETREINYLITNQLEFEQFFEETPIQGTDQLSQFYLDDLAEAMFEGLATNNYSITLKPWEFQELALVNEESGMMISDIVRIHKQIDDQSPSCTTWISLDDEELAAGGSGSTANRGVCGAIATLHSIVKLKFIKPEQVFSDGYIKKKAIKAVQKMQAIPLGMTEKELIKVHKAAGAKVCKASGRFKTNNPSGLSRFNQSLSRFVNDRNKTWDCSLFVRSKKKNRFTLAHVEHVTGMTTQPVRNSRFVKAKIATLNGLDQGNQKTTIPQSAGSNTWDSNPKARPSCKLSGSTHEDGAKYIKALPAVQYINYVCCR